MLQQEKIGRPEAEHHDRMAIEAVAEPLAPIERQILSDRQRHDVAQAATVEIAGGGVMGGVRALPIIVGRQGDDAEHAPDPVVERAVTKEGAVTAIVLDEKQPHQKSGRGQSQREGQPVADMHQRPHRRPKRDEGREGDGDFGQAPREFGVAIAGEHAGKPLRLRQGGRRRRRQGAVGHRIPASAPNIAAFRWRAEPSGADFREAWRAGLTAAKIARRRIRRRAAGRGRPRGRVRGREQTPRPAPIRRRGRRRKLRAGRAG